MKEDLYLLEKRGGEVLFHWLYFNISGLYDVKDKPKPIKFSVEGLNLSQMHYETFELLKPDYEYIEERDISNYNIIKLPGALLLNGVDKIPDENYRFIREQILIKNNLMINKDPHRYIYITRNKSHLLQSNGDERRRQLINENDAYPLLQKYNFEYIELEQLSFKEKIKLFQEAKVIVTPNGGALSISAFANDKTKVIEIHSNRVKLTNQYYNICKVIGIEIIRYTNVEFIYHDQNNTNLHCTTPFNMKIGDLDDFEKFIIAEIAYTSHDPN
jgi:hypothetical protein